MEGRCDGSAVPESSLPERKGSDVGRRPEATSGQNPQAASGSAETEEAVDQRTDGSDLERGENSIENPDRVFPQDELPGSLSVSKGDSFCPEAPNSVCPVFLDYPGGEASPCKHTTDLQLQPPEEQTDPERRSGENIYSSVLHQLLQQQKHKPGRKYKKKSLMKMAKLLVVAKGWDRRENQSLSLEEESDLREEIFTSIWRKQAPENLKTSRNLSQPSDLQPDEQKESGETSSKSVGEETKIPPESREPAPKPTSRRRKKATKAPKAAGKKKDPSEETSGGSGSDFTHKNKEEKPQMDLTAGKDPELRFKKKTVRKWIREGMMVEPSETESLAVSPGTKRKRNMDSATHIHPAPTAAEADAGLSSQTGNSSLAGNIAAQETQTQESKKKPRKGRNPSSEQLATALQDQTKLEEKVSSLDVFPKLKPGKREAKTKASPSSASVWDQLSSAETSNIQNETGIKDSNMQQKRAAPKGKRSKIFPVKEEKSDLKKFSQKQDEDPIRSWKKPKSRVWRRKITEQTLNLQIKAKPVWEAPDFPLMDTTSASTENQPDRRRKPRKRKHMEDDVASQSVEVTTPGSPGDEAGGSRKKENQELHVSDEPDEGSQCRKIRRSCTLGVKASSASEEWLIRYLKGSRRRASSKGSNGKAEGIPDGAELLGKDEQLLVSENGTKFKQTKRGRKKTAELSADGETVPGNDPTLPALHASALGSNQQKEVKMRRKKGKGQKPEDVPASGGQTGATPEPNQINLLQIEGTTDPKEDFLGVRTIRRKTGPKRRRVLKKDMRTGPKILESDEHSEEGDPGAPEHGKPSSVKSGRKKKVLTIKMEDRASCFMEMDANKEPETEKSQLMPSFQDESNATESGGETGAGPEMRGKMNLLQIEGTSNPKEDFLGANSKVMPRKIKRETKKRRILKKRSIIGPKILESEEERPQDPGAPDEGETYKTANVRCGRKRNVFTVKSEDRSSVQDRSSSMESGGQTGAIPELPEPNQLNLLPIEGTSELKEDFLGANSKVRTTRMKRGPKKRRILRKHSISEPKILESDDKHPQEGDPGAPEDGKPSIQDRSNSMDSGGQTRATPEPPGSNQMNLLPIEGTSDVKDDFLGANAKGRTVRRKTGQPRRRGLKADTRAGPKILESEEEHPQGGDPGAPEDGKPSSMRSGRKKNVFTIKLVDGSSVQDRSNSMESGGRTGATPEPNRLNLLQIEGTSDLKEDFLGANSKVRTKRMKRGPKKRRILRKHSISEPKILESDEHSEEGDPGAPEDGKPSSVKSGRKKKVLTIKMEDRASCFMEMDANKEPEREKSQLMPSFQDESNATESGGETGAGPEMRGKMNLLQIEGVLTDPKGDSAEVFSKVRGWKRRRTLQKDSRRHKTLESNEERSYGRDPGAPEDGKICKTSNIRSGRKKKVLTIKMEDEASCFMEMEANQELERKKPFQESASSAAPRKTTRKRRRRSKTHWTGDRKAKKPPVRSLCDVPTISTSCDETFNVQHGNQENRMMPNVPCGPGICCCLQEKKNLQCPFCLRSFRHISALTLHKRLHTGRKPYGCSVCAKSFSKLSQLKLHLRLHSELPAARVPCCEETFRDKTELIRHLKLHLNEVERLQADPGRNRRSRSTAGLDTTFRCPVCSKEFTKKSAMENHRRIHDKKPIGCRERFRDPRKIRGFLVSEVGDVAVVTPVFFKCPICRQVHRRWCHYILHLQSHASGKPGSCGACRQEYSQPAGSRRHCLVCCRASGEEAACRGSLEDIWKEAGASGSPSPNAEHEGKISAFPEGECNGKMLIPQPLSGGSSPSVIEDFDFHIPSPNSGFSDPTFNQFDPEPPRLSVRSWCRRFGSASTHWNKRGPHRRLRQRAFRCSRCELEFHFLGSYLDHLQEHVAETPHACPSCPGTFSHEAQLESHHVSSRHRQPDGLKCSSCGKLFSTPRNLRKHELLHKGGGSHICLPCSRSFSCPSALKAHLEAHRRRLSVPQPAPVQEPFLFPYPCRRCSARFSSTDLLEAHQVCHFIAGRKPESPPESILSFIPNLQTVGVSSSGPRRKLPVSNKKDLFRYPHPDRLYVVPAVSSEPLAVVPQQEAEDSPPRISAELQLQLLVKSLIPEKRLTASDSSDSEGELATRRAICAICARPFADVATLHEHYRNHARGM